MENSDFLINFISNDLNSNESLNLNCINNSIGTNQIDTDSFINLDNQTINNNQMELFENQQEIKEELIGINFKFFI